MVLHVASERGKHKMLPPGCRVTILPMLFLAFGVWVFAGDGLHKNGKSMIDVGFFHEHCLVPVVVTGVRCCSASGDIETWENAMERKRRSKNK
jgi:hypothetical protein